MVGRQRVGAAAVGVEVRRWSSNPIHSAGRVLPLSGAEVVKGGQLLCG